MDEREARIAELEEALELIAKEGCERFTGAAGSCWDNPALSVDAKYGADRVCHACIATSALHGVPLRDSQVHHPLTLNVIIDQVKVPALDAISGCMQVFNGLRLTNEGKNMVVRFLADFYGPYAEAGVVYAPVGGVGSGESHS